MSSTVPGEIAAAGGVNGCHNATLPLPVDIGWPGRTKMTLIQVTVNAAV